MGRKPVTFEQFLVRARAAHGDRYRYFESEYKGWQVPMPIECPEVGHGLWPQLPYKHCGTSLRQGQGCPQCAARARTINRGYRMLERSEAPEFFWAMPRWKEEAVAVGAVRFFTGYACPRGHISPGLTSQDNWCEECFLTSQKAHRTKPEVKAKLSAEAKARYWADPEKHRKTAREHQRLRHQQGLAQGPQLLWRLLNPDRTRQHDKDKWERILADPERHEDRKEKQREYHHSNASTIHKKNRQRWAALPKEVRRKRNKANYMANRSLYHEQATRRRAFKQKALINLTDVERAAVLELYVIKERVNREAGQVLCHVDHLLPLKQGGKHHPANLLLMTAEANLYWGPRVKCCPWPRPADWNEPAWEIDGNG